MNEELKKKIIIRNAFLWGGAFITPPFVMVIVDATTRETPNQNAIAIFSTFVLMGLFVLSNAMLNSALQTESGDQSGDGQAADQAGSGDSA